MHVAKYKQAAAPMMMHHYRRDRAATLARPNIDETRTRLNYTIGEARGYGAVKGAVDYVNEHGARKVRSDAVVMADLVVTLPDNVPPSDARRFFRLCYEYMAGSVGLDNLLGGYVHMDETTPHMHLPFVPLTTSAKGLPTLSYKRLCPRSWYQGLHTGMAAYVAERLGYEPHLLLTEEERAERVYTEKTGDIDRMRKAVADLTSDARGERAEAEAERDMARLAAKRANNERASASVAALLADNERRDAEGERDDALNDRDMAVYERDMARAEAMAAEADAVRARDELATLSAQVSDLRGKVADLASERAGIAADIQAAKERAGKRKAAIKAEADQLRGTVSELRTDVEGLEARKTALEAAVADSGAALDEIRADTSKAEHRRSAAVSEAREAEKERDALKGEVADLRGVKSKIEKAMDQLAERFGHLAEAVEFVAATLPGKGMRKAAVERLSALAGNPLLAEAVAGFRGWWQSRPEYWDADARAGAGRDPYMDGRMEDEWDDARARAVPPTREEAERLRAEVEEMRGKMPPRPQVGRAAAGGPDTRKR